MLKYSFLVATFLVTSAGFSQNRQSRHFRVEGFSVKTDALALFNSILSSELKSCYISGEMYFNNDYSISIDFGAESEKQLGWKRNVKKIGSHFRWYLMQDDCSCSAFFIGAYYSFERDRQWVDQKYLRSNAVSYNMSSSEGGFSGGYQALIARHFVIDPAVHIGLKIPHDIYYTESNIRKTNVNDEGLLLRISLGIGYRF